MFYFLHQLRHLNFVQLILYILWFSKVSVLYVLRCNKPRVRWDETLLALGAPKFQLGNCERYQWVPMKTRVPLYIWEYILLLEIPLKPRYARTTYIYTSIPYLDLAPGLTTNQSWGHMTCTGFIMTESKKGVIGIHTKNLFYGSIKPPFLYI